MSREWTVRGKMFVEVDQLFIIIIDDQEEYIKKVKGRLVDKIHVY